MLFSLIVPFYNVEQYIGKCLSSIDAQLCRDFEVILVDDGSKDETRQLVEEFIRGRETQYRVISQNNRGLSAARNTALKYVAGEYLIFIDSDDWIEANYLSYIKSIIKESSPDIIRCKWFENDAKETVNSDVYGKMRCLETQNVLESVLLDRYGSQVWKNIYRANLWWDVEFPEGLLYEDLYTTHRVFAKAQSVYFCDKAFYHYMIRANSISTTVKFGRAKGLYFGFKNRLEWINTHGEYEKLKEEILDKTWNHLLQYVHECARFQEEIQSAKEECSEMLIVAKACNYQVPFFKFAETVAFLKGSKFYRVVFRLVRR
ncbi:glycosyltransferase family 2 protein [Eubacterium sp. ER2]|uniref:glycosyltransferase family 2 protein n=1 Tax=Eubacterium sp. ER2 TaxID=1519438 RepID=UPI00051C5340|nr:glycosyltransferase family 2 protein [Eubacterium sp. ER2]